MLTLVRTLDLDKAWNPQANAILQRKAHQVLEGCLRNFDLDTVYLDEEHEFLLATAYAIQSTVHTNLGASPGHLVFWQRHDLTNTVVEADLQFRAVYTCYFKQLGVFRQTRRQTSRDSNRQ